MFKWPFYFRLVILSNIHPGKYRHYKGHKYQVIGVARHNETLEELVVYKALYKSEDWPESQLWVRPAQMFLEEVEVSGKKILRFTYLGKD